MTQISSFDDLQRQWPTMTWASGSEAKGGCPFCPTDHTTTYNDNGISFSGYDRFWVRPHAILAGGTCRECGRQGRGDRGTGWYSFKSILVRLGLTAASHVRSADPSERKDDPLTKLWHDFQVEAAHADVDYAYWYDKCRWSRELVDRFKLGWGDIKTAYIGPAHVIPMKIRNVEREVDGWYMEARKDGIKPHRTPGSSGGHFWPIELESTNQILCISESAKNNITLQALGFRNTISTFGAGNVSRKLVEWIWARGYRHLVLLGDQDPAGKTFNDNLCRYANDIGKFDSVKVIDWPDHFSDNYDITDLYRDLGGVNVREAIEGYLIDAFVPRLPESTEPESIFDLDEIRGEGPNSTLGEIRRYYETFTPGEMLILGVAMGGGKTHSLVRDTEERARGWLVQRALDREVLEKEIALLEEQLKVEFDARSREEVSKLLFNKKQSLENFSVAGLAWYAQYRAGWDDLMDVGAESSLWFEYKARGDDNCDNYELVTRLAAQNHDIGKFCHQSCPFAAKCRESGYLAQDATGRNYPIWFFRHQNLVMEKRNTFPVGIVIDENPTHLWRTPIIVEAKDLYPFSEETDTEDPYYHELIIKLMTAIRAAMSTNAGAKVDTPEYEIRGGRFLALIEKQLDMPLELLIEQLEESEIISEIQPNYVQGDIIKKRVIEEVVDAIKVTLPLYLENKNIHNNVGSTIHLVSGDLHIFTRPNVRVRNRTPLIVADGTVMPSTVEAMFKRKSRTVRLDFRNENAQTVQITNSDWTKGQWNKEIGNKAIRAKAQRDRLIAKSAPEEPIFLTDLPVGQDLYDSRYLQEATELIQGLAEKHDTLLVVCYKAVREVIEDQLFMIEPELKRKVALSHYGSLRGTNQYKDWEAVLLIGAYRIPYRVLYREISMWAFSMGDKSIIDDQTVVMYEMYDGQSQGYEYRTFAHTFANAYVQQFEKSEIWQSAMRIRPHSTKKAKYIYVAMGRPVGKAITEVVGKKEFLDRYRPSKINAMYRELIKIGKHTLQHEGKVKLPSVRDLEKNYSVSRTTIRKVKDRIKLEGHFPTWNGN